MKGIIISILLFIIPFFGTDLPHKEEAREKVRSFSLVAPASVRQGDPFILSIDGTNEISDIGKLTFDGKKIGVFIYQEKPTAVVGIDLNKKQGTYELQAELSNGQILKQNVVVDLRDKIETPLGIPSKLGGDTKASQDKLVSSLNADNKILAGLPTESKALWTDTFILPLEKIFVTAPYGNSRKTGAYSIPHKGVDYRAPIGTKVVAMNSGVVRINQEFRNHGKTLVIDHGLGLMSFYLHMSEISPKVGDVVERGQTIGLSGDSGYTMGAHLHFAIRINDVAIDPLPFFELFNSN